MAKHEIELARSGFIGQAGAQQFAVICDLVSVAVTPPQESAFAHCISNVGYNLGYGTDIPESEVKPINRPP